MCKHTHFVQSYFCWCCCFCHSNNSRFTGLLAKTQPHDIAISWALRFRVTKYVSIWINVTLLWNYSMDFVIASSSFISICSQLQFICIESVFFIITTIWSLIPNGSLCSTWCLNNLSRSLIFSNSNRSKPIEISNIVPCIILLLGVKTSYDSTMIGL